MRYTITGATPEKVQEAGGQDIKATRYTGHIFATLTESQAAGLRALPGVRVREVGTITAPRPQQTGSTVSGSNSLSDIDKLVGLDQIRNIFTSPLLGDGLNVAIIDTGIRESHELINGRVVYRYNATSDAMEDGFDHGTGVASIVVALAPHVNILSIKVIDNSGLGTDESVVTGIDQALSLAESNPQYAPQVINLSLGAEDDDDPENPVRVACRTAIAQGVFVIAGAGNDGPGAATINSPACEQDVVAVGSVGYLPDTNSFAISSFSSRGPTLSGLIKPDAVQFGENIVVASSASDTATATKSGTSFSCPIVSAMSALYLEAAYFALSQTGQSPQQGPLDAALYQTAWNYLPLISLKPPGAPPAKDDIYGCGLPLGTLALGSAQQASTSALQTSSITTVLSEFLVPAVVIAVAALLIKELV